MQKLPLNHYTRTVVVEIADAHFDVAFDEEHADVVAVVVAFVAAVKENIDIMKWSHCVFDIFRRICGSYCCGGFLSFKSKYIHQTLHQFKREG